jgi:hypothetical protein
LKFNDEFKINSQVRKSFKGLIEKQIEIGHQIDLKMEKLENQRPKSRQ